MRRHTFLVEMSYPQRPRPHELEEASKRFFQSCLPPAWTADLPDHDYGIDVRVNIFDKNTATNLEFIVQLKSAEKPSGGDDEILSLGMKTYNYLWDMLPVAMLVKYVASEDEAYWLLLRDVVLPDQTHESVTVRIPRGNKLSSIDWEQIRYVVRDVTAGKLAARRSQKAE